MKCLNCDSEITDEMVESLDSEYVVHHHPADDFAGAQYSDHYCNPACFVEVHND